tara:strand:- start:21 stop:599 length:579 start_codon:yes stop_codon:yes gene_type:complete
MAEKQYEEINGYSLATSTEYHFEVNKEIECPEQFEEMIGCLRQSGPNDTIYIHLNSPGGCLETTIQVIGAMRNSQATVVTCAEGSVASGAAIIFFAGHMMTLVPHCEFLIHTARGGMGGKLPDQLSTVASLERRLLTLYDDVFGGFLTKRELGQVKNGRELFLTSEDVEQRLQEYMARMQQDAEEQETELED